MKQLPVEADVPEYLCLLGNSPSATELEAVVGDSVVVAFYYLLRVGEYTTKGTKQYTKQTVQFKLEDATFFKKDTTGRLRQLQRNADDSLLLTAESATLKLDNQKNGWKGVCIHQETNGEAYACPVKALARRYIHIRNHTNDCTTHLSAYYIDGIKYDVTDKHISVAVKMAATTLGAILYGRGNNKK